MNSFQNAQDMWALLGMTVFAACAVAFPVYGLWLYIRKVLKWRRFYKSRHGGT